MAYASRSRVITCLIVRSTSRVMVKEGKPALTLVFILVSIPWRIVTFCSFISS